MYVSRISNGCNDDDYDASDGLEKRASARPVARVCFGQCL